MKDLNNIEDLFRENLSGFEADPGVGVWESISQNLPAQNAVAGTTAGAAGKFTVLKWIAGITLLSGGIGIGAIYLNSEQGTSNEKTAQKEQTENQSEKNTNSNSNENTSENTISESSIEEPNQLQEAVIVKDEKKNKTIIVSVKENPRFNMNKSSVDSWITKRTNYTMNSSTNAGGEEVAVITSDTKTEAPVTYEVKVVDESKPIAAITRSIVGGPAPLTVTFSNATEEKSYEWNIGGYSIHEESYTHVFEVPGTYKVKLTVKDAKGNKATDEVEVVVGEPVKKENPSKLEAKGVNVFTPNNDGVNDYFYIHFEYENLESFLLQVLNLNGEIIFETNDPEFKWDGTMRNGEVLPVGTYFYNYMAVGKDKMKYKDSKPFKVTK